MWRLLWPDDASYVAGGGACSPTVPPRSPPRGFTVGDNGGSNPGSDGRHRSRPLPLKPVKEEPVSDDDWEAASPSDPAEDDIADGRRPCRPRLPLRDASCPPRLGRPVQVVARPCDAATATGFSSDIAAYVQTRAGDLAQYVHCYNCIKFSISRWCARL